MRAARALWWIGVSASISCAIASPRPPMRETAPADPVQLAYADIGTGSPILVVHGALDREMDLAGGRRLADLARKRKGKAGSAVKLAEIAGVNHLLVKATSGELDEYADLPDKRIDSEVPATIAGWVKELGRK